jgi:hypothetical protein
LRTFSIPYRRSEYVGVLSVVIAQLKLGNEQPYGELPTRWIGIMPISPFRTKFVIGALNKNLCVASAQTGVMRGLNRNAYGVCLSGVGARMFPLKTDLPMALMDDHVVVRSRLNKPHFNASLS